MAHYRNLTEWAGFTLDGTGFGVRLVPSCECWKMRPRWTVQRVFWFWWRCVDCGRFARKAGA